MKQTDFKAFSETYAAAWSFHKPINQQQIALAFELLKSYPINIVVEGIKAHCIDPDRGQFPPKPADVVAQMQKWMPQRIGADEAWTMLPASEADTVVWTDEMAEAHAVCSKEHDKIAKRMAFKAAYERIVERNKASNVMPKWVVSEGWDQDKKIAVLNDAVRLGRLNKEQVDMRLLETGSMTLLLENHYKVDPEQAKKNLNKLREMLTK